LWGGGAGDRKPYQDADGLIHWPVMFVYPEAMQNDCIEDFSEAHTFRDHLDVMFGEGTPPLVWDEAGNYTRERVQLYYLSHAGKPMTREQLVEV
jgi:Cns1/TTC4 Wheel domain